jgi:hypothetical protein
MENIKYVKLKNANGRDRVIPKRQLNNIKQTGTQTQQPIEYEEVSDIEVMQTLLRFGGLD